MSIRVMAMVWEYAPYEGGTLLTLLAMADWSNDDGWCWPSIPTLAKKTRQSESNTRYCIRRMEQDGALLVEKNAAVHGANRYRINIEKLAEIASRAIPEKSKRGGYRAPNVEGHQTLRGSNIEGGGSNMGGGPPQTDAFTPSNIGPNTLYTSIDTSVDTSRARKPRAPHFVPPSVAEVTAYCQERKNSIDPQQFIDRYISVGWKVGSNPMRDWKAAVRTWEKRTFPSGNGRRPAQSDFANLDHKGSFGLTGNTGRI